MANKEGIYALYKGDKFIDLGTVKQLARTLNVKPETIRRYATPTHKGNCEEYHNKLIVIKIEGD